jgi:hypothetical protein
MNCAICNKPMDPETIKLGVDVCPEHFEQRKKELQAKIKRLFASGWEEREKVRIIETFATDKK